MSESDINQNQPQFETPSVVERDTSFVDVINKDYVQTIINNITLSDFKANYLDSLARDQSPEEFEINKQRWIREVAKSPRLPVRVVDDNDHSKVLQLVPPMVGTIKTGSTGTPVSMDARIKAMTNAYHRLTTSGEQYEAVLFKNIDIDDESEYIYKLAWYKILRDFGYLGKKHTQHQSIVETPITIEEDPDDFVY